MTNSAWTKENENKAHSGNINAHEKYDVPDQAAVPTLAMRTHNSIQVVGVAPGDGGRLILSYDWQYREAGTTTWINRSDQTALTQTFSGLTASTTYEFQFRASNTLGDSAYSFPTATTMTLSPPADASASGCNYYHDHEGGLGSYGSTNCIPDDDMQGDGYVPIGKKTIKETYYHWHEDDNDNGGVMHRVASRTTALKSLQYIAEPISVFRYRPVVVIGKWRENDDEIKYKSNPIDSELTDAEILAAVGDPKRLTICGRVGGVVSLYIDAPSAIWQSSTPILASRRLRG